jgi:hypothetical protein
MGRVAAEKRRGLRMHLRLELAGGCDVLPEGRSVGGEILIDDESLTVCKLT